MPEDFAPVVTVAFMMMIPIIAILTSHQRKMAEIIHGRNREAESLKALREGLSGSDSQLASEVRSLREEVANLRDTVNRQTILLDSRLAAGGSLEDRLEAR